MNDQSDSQLLHAYAESHSEAAFTELVRRHVDFVYSAARRMVCDPHLAEDVTQGVFVAFARNARQLADRSVFSGWLHRTAQNIAAQTVRTIERRRAREQEAVAMNELLAHEPDADWQSIAPHLDTALGELSEPDRDALLLRYFERKSAREMAQTLGTSEEAAQKRVNRAVERLREFFSKRNVTIGTSGLVVLISANAVQAAPVGLVAVISSAVSLVGTAIQTSTAIGATKTIAMTTLQKTLITTTVTILASAGIYEVRQILQLREKNQILRQQQVPLEEQIQRLEKDQNEAKIQTAALVEEIAKNKNGNLELLRLRNEVGMLRNTTNQLHNDIIHLQTIGRSIGEVLTTKNRLSEEVANRTLVFDQMPLGQVIDVYAKMAEAEFDVDKHVNLASKIAVKTIKPLTPSAVLQLLDRALHDQAVLNVCAQQQTNCFSD
ncbi:MAG: sigma-70 family RNA polymerase sigma factor [Verrucomicrobiota bacterium]